MGSQLKVCKWDDNSVHNSKRLVSLLEALGALGGTTYCPKSIQPAMPAVVEKLKEVAELAQKLDADDDEKM